jgi:enamine deaminase RidA (YjgF/YER057c/UK114 family)
VLFGVSLFTVTTTKKNRTNFASGSPFEPLRGYSRAVRVGDQLFISGTTAMTAKGDVAAPGDAYLQTKAVLATVRNILTTGGFTLADVVRTRLFVTNMVKWEDYARAHREVFEKIRPASSMVQVAKLVDPRLVIEMEVDAILSDNQVVESTIHYPAE